MTRPIVRDRSALPFALRRIDLIAADEIASAILVVAQDSFGVEFGEISTAVSKLLGFGRSSEDIRMVVEIETKALIANGKLELRGSMPVSTSAN